MYVCMYDRLPSHSIASHVVYEADDDQMIVGLSSDGGNMHRAVVYPWAAQA